MLSEISESIDNSLTLSVFWPRSIRLPDIGRFCVNFVAAGDFIAQGATPVIVSGGSCEESDDAAFSPVKATPVLVVIGGRHEEGPPGAQGAGPFPGVMQGSTLPNPSPSPRVLGCRRPWFENADAGVGGFHEVPSTPPAFGKAPGISLALGGRELGGNIIFRRLFSLVLEGVLTPPCLESTGAVPHRDDRFGLIRSKYFAGSRQSFATCSTIVFGILSKNLFRTRYVIFRTVGFHDEEDVDVVGDMSLLCFGTSATKKIGKHSCTL